MLRARRVQAHSVVQRDPRFKNYVAGQMSLRLTERGEELIQELPKDEEVFESFATRVRAVTLGKDDVHYKNVIRALLRVDMKEHGDKFNTKFHEDLAGLRERWENTVHPKGDGVGWISFRIDLSQANPREEKATMQQLAESWMYADVAHTNVWESARAGTAFSLMERYQAAVTYHSRIGALILETGAMIHFMNTAGAIQLSDHCLDAEVAFTRDIDEEEQT